MQSFSRSGHRIAFEVHGTGRPVVMLHGITVSFAGNFGPSGWIQRSRPPAAESLAWTFEDTVEATAKGRLGLWN